MPGAARVHYGLRMEGCWQDDGKSSGLHVCISPSQIRFCKQLLSWQGSIRAGVQQFRNPAVTSFVALEYALCQYIEALPSFMVVSGT